MFIVHDTRDKIRYYDKSFDTMDEAKAYVLKRVLNERSATERMIRINLSAYSNFYKAVEMGLYQLYELAYAGKEKEFIALTNELIEKGCPLQVAQARNELLVHPTQAYGCGVSSNPLNKDWMTAKQAFEEDEKHIQAKLNDDVLEDYSQYYVIESEVKK